MAYSDFTTLTKVREAFGLTIEESIDLFTNIPEVLPSDYLQTTLNENVFLATAINTEKARSELIIVPVLLEVRRMLNFQIGFFSGSEFNVDVPAGLSGYCDYILTASKESYEIQTPVITLVEAKNESIKSGLGQCIAEMVAAQLFNQRNGEKIESIYGAVTTGTDWKFLKLTHQNIWIDKRDYFINEISQILGILAMPFKALCDTMSM
ncbi:MAG TPA: hypothetical protein DEG17_02975 [Cyanobacteria bacterium UBA11149]|nr:hypothetical protein [Cyanobacteria bacterium UBA11367]HBE57740.1 hypothetical protein [Cyanobacteria bacterium UBA11366]HBK62026.1 hypothetical protein [Cyanobacteria bacterium UBA11166]HBR76998.1 hypothetical protein [Cyanobacteria bacterium UBA11159]HBS67608.1 hypothetical protein [Cyanobacteria bacterium UBA11153]HBW87869.1 hypothetical protein [Cyanobacteria bacterium UBA11149]HCA96918.1 hypothetical protein [Cyanobacteria bacterium UBA9226]